ncbi:hypothetical protein [Caballeronia sp. INDeC2]|uniref:hypothetical protein n=1 Tax=Caballeronia sp. INDeC2 TaxID=2921747 RepID=UPI002028D6C9|nr:hypothetical protein [Caballeronia sp. INDeC2]
MPDALARGMRMLLGQRLIDEHAYDKSLCTQAFERLLAEPRASPIAIDTQAANAQHYELPDASVSGLLRNRFR